MTLAFLIETPWLEAYALGCAPMIDAASGTTIRRLFDAHATGVREHYVQRPLSTAAKHERAHLQSAVEHSRLSEVRVRHIIVDGTIGDDRNAARCDAFGLKHGLAVVDLAVAVDVDEYDEARVPAALISASSEIE